MHALVVVVAVVSLFVMPAPAVAQSRGSRTPPAGWSDTMNKALELTVADKEPAVIELLEGWVAKHPDFADGYYMLGAAHEAAARAMFRSRTPDSQAAIQKHFETAAVHMFRGLEVAGRDATFDLMRGLIDLHGVLELNRPAEFERLVRESVRRFPAEPLAQAYLLALLAAKGEPIAPAARAARAARAAMHAGADARADLAHALVRQVRQGSRLTPGLVPALMPEASRLVDEALALKPGDAGAMRVRADIAAVSAAMSARLPLTNEDAVKNALYAISNAQRVYARDCGRGYYGPTLASLAKPAPDRPEGFLPDLFVPAGSAFVLEKYGSRIEMSAVPSPTSPASCNGVPAGGSAQTFSIVARPMEGWHGRTFRIDAKGDLTIAP
jgi:hypothetical protein